MLPSRCPRCGELSEGGLCRRCAAYVLRFDPFVLRPGLPGPSVDREARPATAWLTLDPREPVRYRPPGPRREDDAFAIQFLRHVGLPDGGAAALTREDRAVLQRLLRRWARVPPTTEPLRSRVLALYEEAASLPGMPAPARDAFQRLARGSAPPPIAEIPPPEPILESGPAPEPEPERAPEPEVPPPSVPVQAPPAVEREPMAAPPLPPPPPPDHAPPEPSPEEMRVLTALRAEVAAKREELTHWLEEQHRDMARREGLVRSQVDELHGREAQIADKERAVAAEEQRLRARAADVQRRADEATTTEAKRSLFFLLLSMKGVGRKAARAVSEAFGTEERLRAAGLEQIAAVPGVPTDEAALIRDSLSGGVARPRQDLREKAQEMLEEGQANEALDVFEEIVRMNPEDVDAWFNRGEVLAALGRIDEAIDSYECLLELDPANKAARSELAALLFERGDFGGAAVQLQNLLENAPEQVADWLARASSLLAEGRTTEATLIYNAVLEGDPDNLTASLALGDLLLAMGDAETADREYTRALQRHPDDPDALVKKGLLVNRQGRWGAAIQLFNRAIAVRWDHLDAWAAKGQVLLAQGKPKESLECFDKLTLFNARRPDAWLGKAEAHFALGENDKAAEAAGRALTLDAGNKDVRALLDRLRDSTDVPKEAVEVAAVPPTGVFDAGVLVEMADTLLASGDPEGALRGFNEVLARDLKNGPAWFGKGRALHALERYGEAVRCLTAAVEHEPANQEYARWLARCEEQWRREGT